MKAKKPKVKKPNEHYETPRDYKKKSNPAEAPSNGRYKKIIERNDKAKRSD